MVYGKDGMKNQNAATLQAHEAGGRLAVTLKGDLTLQSVPHLWSKAERVCTEGVRDVIIDAGGVTAMDSAGAALLMMFKTVAEKRQGEFRLTGLGEAERLLFDRYPTPAGPDQIKGPERLNKIEQTGKAVVEVIADFRAQVAFFGELCVKLLQAVVRPKGVRWRDCAIVFEKTGVNGLMIVALISFLVGLIMAFQSAMALKQFGVSIFAINLVALALLRELAPVMTAVVVAGRSGSAFAAEIGTMTVREEINALRTMGLDPVRYLAVPRTLSAVAALPLLTIYSNLIGILGGVFVMMLLGFTWTELLLQLQSVVTVDDGLAGLIKSLFFGFIIAAVGCERGLQTGGGATAVGNATTRAVVASILYVIAVDAVFAVVYYSLDF